jgi:hypothetical protein
MELQLATAHCGPLICPSQVRILPDTPEKPVRGRNYQFPSFLG